MNSPHCSLGTAKTIRASSPRRSISAPEITYDEQFYPARPKRLPPVRAPLRCARAARRPPRRRRPVADNREYVEWLVEQSMLPDANRLATQLSGQGCMWQNPFAHPDPRAALERASVWFTAYPLSFVTARGRVVPVRARRPRAVAGVPPRSASTRVHTGPVKQAGGLNGRRLTPSIDGHFDRISMEVDPEFGTEEQFRTLCATAAEYEGTIIDDIVPGHTGKGADFRLAEMGLRGLPGHLPHGLDRARRLAPAARGPGGPRQRRTSTPRPRPCSSARLHHRPPAAGDLLRARHQGDQLVGDRAWSRASTASTGAGSTCTTSRRASRRSTGSTRPSPACGW